MRSFIKSILSKNEPKDMKETPAEPVGEPILIDMNEVCQAFHIATYGRLGDFKREGLLDGFDVSASHEGLTLTGEITISDCVLRRYDKPRVRIPKIKRRVEIVNISSHPWTQSQFEKRVSQSAMNACDDIKEMILEAIFEVDRKYDIIHKFTIADGKVEPFELERKDVRP